MEKKCKQCGEVKTKDNFNRHPNMVGGLRHQCKACEYANKGKKRNTKLSQACHAVSRRKKEKEQRDAYINSLPKMWQPGGRYYIENDIIREVEY